MPTATEIQNVVQDKVLESVRVGQRAVVDSVRSWADTVETVFSRLPEISFSPETQAPPTQAIENVFGFADKLLASQREFAAQVFEAAVPAAKAGASATAQATAKATQAARSAANKV